MRDFKNVRSLAALRLPSHDGFYYPVGKRRAEQTIQAMRKAEWNLNNFWQAVDRYFIDKGKSSQHDRVQHLFSVDRQVQRTPAYTGPVQGRKDANVKLEAVHVPLPQPALYSQSRDLTRPLSNKRSRLVELLN